MSEKRLIARAAGIVGSATLLSRVFGLVRDLVTAYFFGAGMAADAFFVAFRIPNLLRRLLAEGAMTVSFIPIFTEYLEQKGRNSAFELARAMLTAFSLVLALVTVLGVLLSPWIIMIFAPGFTDQPDKYELTVLLTQIMFPYIFLVGLVALAMGILNSLNKFAAPALAPVFLNLGMIGSILALKDFFDPPILALAVGVVVGGVLQVTIQVPFLVREGRLIALSWDFRHPALKRIAWLMAPAALGAAVYQFTVFLNTLIASFLPQGSVSYLYYADRVMQFPLGVFAVAMGTAVLPSLSRQAAVKDLEGLKDTLSFSLRLLFFITIPAMIGLMVLAEPMVALLFQRGQFDAAATRATALALVAYSLGLWSLSAVQILVRVFYSLQDTKTPVKIAIISLVGNVVIALSLMGPMQHVGLALASTGGSILNFILLVVFLTKRLDGIDGKRVIRAVVKYLVWSLLMGGLVYWLFGAGDLQGSAWILAGRVLGGIGVGVGVYLGLCLVFRSPETEAVFKVIFRTRTKNKST